MSGFSDGAGPGGQTGRCLFGIGIGHAAEVLMLSRLRVGVKGWGEEDRVWPAGISRGRAMVAIISIYLTMPVVEQEQRPGALQYLILDSIQGAADAACLNRGMQ